MNMFEDKADCCGCGACVAVCPQKAITMKEDEQGFRFPYVNNEKCVGCGACNRVCIYKNDVTFNELSNVFACQSKDDFIVKKCSSGGVVGLLARDILLRGGVIYGAVLYKENGSFSISHERVEDISNYTRILGSKYVQSKVEHIFDLVNKDLINGKEVLFTGTPCQIAALKKYLGREYSSLGTVEVLCHGVPSQKLMRDWIAYLEKRYHKKVCNIDFRDKTSGWGHNLLILFEDGSIIKKQHKKSSFYQLFLQSTILRDSCYSCKFKQEKRVAEVSVGDFWGIKKSHPEFFEKVSDDNFVEKKGISLVLINSEKGEILFDHIKNDMICYESGLTKISKDNQQIYKKASIPTNRKKIIEVYTKRGWRGVEFMYWIEYPLLILKKKVKRIFKHK